MLKFEQKQVTYDIGGVKIGGQPGEHPTVLIGSIFYSGHKIVQDPKRGIFDEKKAEELIKNQEEMSKITGNPCMLDVVGETPEAMMRYVDFVSETASTPFLLDGVDANVRINALKHIVELGIQNRVVYSTISTMTKSEEIQAIRESKIKNAVVFAFSTYDPTPEGKVALLEKVDGKKGLLEIAKEAGIEQALIDTAVLDISSLVLSCRAIQLVKEKYGFPAGCAPANGVSLWKKAKISKEFYKSCEATASVFTRASGADFILYGSVGAANTVFPATATYDAFLGYARKWEAGVLPLQEHPFYKMF